LSNNGWRHEVLSVQMAIPRLNNLPDAVDRALALWLVGTHHGYGRPFFRHDDPWDAYARTVNGILVSSDPGPHRLDFEWDGSGQGEIGLDWAGLFSLLKRRYGIWGLAFLEAVLRLADHRASEDSVRAVEGSAP
jgi:CRISPR-associated endonuclease/helicase Cas3